VRSTSAHALTHSLVSLVSPLTAPSSLSESFDSMTTMILTTIMLLTAIVLVTTIMLLTIIVLVTTIMLLTIIVLVTTIMLLTTIVLVTTIMLAASHTSRWIDMENMMARVEAGVVGLPLEETLAKHGVCTGHTPDSYVVATRM
jgi:hypothetical protein